MNGERINDKLFTEVEKAIGEAKQKLPAVIVFKPPVNTVCLAYSRLNLYAVRKRLR